MRGGADDRRNRRQGGRKDDRHVSSAFLSFLSVPSRAFHRSIARCRIIDTSPDAPSVDRNL
jgi:hypothetical protein